MSTTTTNYKFIKPSRSDAADIEATNPNWDTLDAKLKSLEASSSDNDTAIGDVQESVKTLSNTVANNTEAIGKKQNTITGAASTVSSSDLTANRVLVSNGSGKISISSITTTLLGYLSGLTSNVQSQINSKLAKAGDTLSGMLTFQNTADYHAFHKYRDVNGTVYGVNVGCGVLGGDGVVTLEVRQGSSTTSELIGRLEIGERGVSFVQRNGKRTYLTNGGVAYAVLE